MRRKTSLPDSTAGQATIALLPHATAPAPAGIRVAAGCARRDGWGVIDFRYILEGPLARLRIPAGGELGRADGLWQHTCLEAFLKPDGADAYLEFNFSPSGEWAAYRFTGRRAGMQPLAGITTPEIRCAGTHDRLEMNVTIDLARCEEHAADSPGRVGLAAVLEDARGDLSYWALRHGGGAPDFHDPVTFMLSLPPLTEDRGAPA